MAAVPIIIKSAVSRIIRCRKAGRTGRARRRRRMGTLHRRHAPCVVESTRLVIAQDLVGFGDLLESVLGVGAVLRGMFIRVPLESFAAIGLLDVRG